MTIFRGSGGGGNATSDAEVAALVAYQSAAANSAAEAAASADAADVSEANASSSASSASTSASNASTSATNASTSASNASTSATNAATSADEAAASAASIDPATLVKLTGDQTIAGVKTFSSTISGSINGNASNVTGTVAIANGGTGATTEATARSALGAATSGANSDITSLTALASVNGGQLAGLRNKIINGNPLINQRGAASASTAYAAGAYFLDRWKAGASGATLSFATADNVVTITITAGSIIQVVEGLNLASGTHTLSWSGTAQGKIGAGSYSSSGVTGSITGGTDTNVEFNTGTLSLVQLEPGSVATPFEHRPYGMELALCQRYCEVWSGQLNLLKLRESDRLRYLPFAWKVRKRAVPTVTVTSSNADGGGAVSVGVSGVDTIQFSNTATADAQSAQILAFTAVAEL